MKLLEIQNQIYVVVAFVQRLNRLYLNKWGQMTLMLFYENNTFLHKTLKMSA